MKFNYYFIRLSKTERDLLEAIMLEELQLQAWFAVAYIEVFGGEILIPIQ